MKTISRVNPIRFRCVLSVTIAFCSAHLGFADRDNGAGSAFIEENLQFAASQYEFLLGSVSREQGFPRSFEANEVTFTLPHQWTSGFLPGSLWMLYEATGDRRWRVHAEAYTHLLESAKTYGRTHDLGFIFFCSYGHAWRLTGDRRYFDVLHTASKTLARRFDTTVGAIKSWDNSPWQFPVIIDNLMNLEMLLWAARNGGPAEWREIAIRHANTTLKNHFRPDASSYHVVGYHPLTGEVESRMTHQGIADSSSWARGQAWALYGYTLLFRETEIGAYRDQALRIARFILKHPNLPQDGVPYWDFDAPSLPNTPRDSSAAAIMASALLELAGFAGENEKGDLTELALRQLKSLGSPQYRAAVGTNGGFILKHGTGNHPKNSEVDTPLVYGDYYFLEALLRAKAHFQGVAPKEEHASRPH